MSSTRSRPNKEHITLGKLQWPILRGIVERAALYGASAGSPYFIYTTFPFDLAFGIEGPNYAQVREEINGLVGLGLLRREGDEHSIHAVTEKGIKFYQALKEARREMADQDKPSRFKLDAEIPL